MKKCIVIGGGIAGFTSTAYLTKKNINVTILETAPKLGGRAYSFTDQQTNTIIDNGQHILMGCYSDTIDFLKLIGAEDNFIYQKRLTVNYLKPGFELIKLKAGPLFYPLNLLSGLLNFNAISLKNRLSLIRFMIKLPFASHQKLIKKSVKEWLIEEKQSDEAISSLWEILAIGALNTNIDKASALMFREILMKIFFNGSFASTIVIPKYGLTESYVNNAINFIRENSGEIQTSLPVKELIVVENKVIKIKTAEGTISDFDYVISAVPFYALNNIYPELFVNDNIELEHSSILNVHLWLKNNTLQEQFYGLINSPVHWIFNKGTHINLVISDANYLMDKSSEDIYKMCIEELTKFTMIQDSDISYYRILKEKRATIASSNNTIYNRPASKTKIVNLFLAGDWTDTGLPSTIESAVKSGRTAAEYIINL
jgi:hydroxysqualene dehydroxylase